jgi:6-phosphofructokinase 1
MGGASAAMALHKMISDEFGFRGEFQITESLPMCAADRAVQLDIDEAYICGQAAVHLAEEGRTGLMVTLQRQPGSEYKCITGVIPLEKVAIKAKPVPDEFINAEGNFITDAFLEYIRPLVGKLPNYTTLEVLTV